MTDVELRTVVALEKIAIALERMAVGPRMVDAQGKLVAIPLVDGILTGRAYLAAFGTGR